LEYSRATGQESRVEVRGYTIAIVGMELYSFNSGLQTVLYTRLLDFASSIFAKSSMSGINQVLEGES